MPTSARLLLYDGIRIKELDARFERSPRWAAWLSSDEIVVVGNSGSITVISLDGESRIIESHTKHNLRCMAVNPSLEEAVIVGNTGTILHLKNNDLKQVETGVSVNIRRAAWKPDGASALIVGNDGAIFSMTGGKLKKLAGVETNLRSITWHPTDDFAIITGNSFRPSFAGLIPTSNLYRFDHNSEKLTSLQKLPLEVAADLTGADWGSTGSNCIIVGYDQVWDKATLYILDTSGLVRQPWAPERVYPSGFAWNRTASCGLIITANLSPGLGRGAVYLLRQGKVEILREFGEDSVSSIAWDRDGERAVMVSSPFSKIFNI